MLFYLLLLSLDTILLSHFCEPDCCGEEEAHVNPSPQNHDFLGVTKNETLDSSSWLLLYQ